MRRPSINPHCVADTYADKQHERIAEFTAPNGKGGLISVRQNDDDTVSVSVYRTDDGVQVAGSSAALSALKAIEGDLMGYVDRLRKDGPRMAISYAAAAARLAAVRATIANADG